MKISHFKINVEITTKGVARGGQMGQQPHPGMSLPHLGGAAGQRWGSRFSGQLKKSYKDN